MYCVPRDDPSALQSPEGSRDHAGKSKQVQNTVLLKKEGKNIAIKNKQVPYKQLSYVSTMLFIVDIEDTLFKLNTKCLFVFSLFPCPSLYSSLICFPLCKGDAQLSGKGGGCVFGRGGDDSLLEGLYEGEYHGDPMGG